MQPLKGDSLGLVDVMLELRQRYGQAPAYNRLWHAVASGEIPAERVGNRWKVRRGDLPQVAAAVGIAIAA